MLHSCVRKVTFTGCERTRTSCLVVTDEPEDLVNRRDHGVGRRPVGREGSGDTTDDPRLGVRNETVEVIDRTHPGLRGGDDKDVLGTEIAVGDDDASDAARRQSGFRGERCFVVSIDPACPGCGRGKIEDRRVGRRVRAGPTWAQLDEGVGIERSHDVVHRDRDSSPQCRSSNVEGVAGLEPHLHDCRAGPGWNRLVKQRLGDRKPGRVQSALGT